MLSPRRAALAVMALQAAYLVEFSCAFQASTTLGVSTFEPSAFSRKVCSFKPVRGDDGTTSRGRRSLVKMADDSDIDMSAFFAEVEKREESSGGGEAMDGPELRKLVMDKWQYPLDTRIVRRRDAFGKQTVWLEVMWKHLWEQSFPMTEEEYDAQLDAVAWYITEWGKADYVREEITNNEKAPGLTVNGGAKVVLINLQVTDAQARMMYDIE